jgi:hypothetical protein
MVTNTNRGEILLLNRLGSFFGILGVLAILRDVVVVVGVAIDAGCVCVEVYIGRGGGRGNLRNLMSHMFLLLAKGCD